MQRVFNHVEKYTVAVRLSHQISFKRISTMQTKKRETLIRDRRSIERHEGQVEAENIVVAPGAI